MRYVCGSLPWGILALTGTLFSGCQVRLVALHPQTTQAIVSKNSSLPSAPDQVDLVVPGSAVGHDDTPTLEIGGVSAGQIVHIYSDSNCSTELIDALTMGPTVQITLPALGDGVYAFYATTESGEGMSACSTAFAVYTLDTVAPSAPTSLALHLPAISPANSSSVEVTVGGLTAGDSVQLFSDAGCTTSVSIAATTSGTSAYMSPTNPLTWGQAITLYAAATDPAGNPSPCSAASVTYTYGLEVAKRYASGTTKWNSYVKSDDSAACTGNESSYSSCVHAGDYRLVWTPETSCAGLALTDGEGWMDWTCTILNGYANFIGTRKSTTKLSTLIDATPAWKTNKVRLTGCSQCPMDSARVEWWDNSLTTAPDSTASAPDLADDSKVYVVNENTMTYGYHIGADGIALVIREGKAMTWDGAAPTNTNNTGGVSGPNRKAMISGGSRKFLWIEGNMGGGAGTRPNHAIYCYNCRFTRLQSLEVSQVTVGGSDAAIAMSGANCTLNDVTIRGAAIDGLTLSASSSLIDTVTVADVLSTDVNLTGSGGTVRNLTIDGGYSAKTGTYNNINLSGSNTKLSNINIRNMVVSNARSLVISGNTNYVKNLYAANTDGVVRIYGTGNRVYDSMFHNSIWNAFELFGNSNVVQQVTVHGSTYRVFQNQASDNRITAISMVNSNGYVYNPLSNAHVTLVHNVASINNTLGAIGPAASANFATYSQIASSSGISVGGSYSKFTGVLMVPANNSCSVSGAPTDPGLTHGDCSTLQGTSDYTLVTGKDFSTTIVGKVLDDATNDSDNLNGQAAYATTLDWFSFENAYRGWGLSGHNFPSADNITRCGSGTCQIWDTSLRDVNTNVLLNRSGDGNNLNSSNDGAGHYLFPLPGNLCPVEVIGTAILRTQAGCLNGTNTDSASCVAAGSIWRSSKPYLKNAIEILDDGVGNDDGFCEANEDCLYTPNFGAYQGYGTLQQCTYNANGGLAGIRVFGYDRNGR